MKKNLSRMLRSGVAMLLVLCMVVGYIPATVFAEEGEEAPEEKPIVYVSIGDSMTNGYGLEGYDGESGIMNYGNNVYANQFAAYLAGYDDEIADDQTVFTGSNGTVDHRQLAMSGMRSEDLAWLLQLDYKNMTDDEIKNVARFRYAVNEANEPWQTDLGDNYCKSCNKYHIHGWQHEWGNGREYWYSYDVENKTAEATGLNFASGDWRTWTDLLDPSYRLADGVVKVLSMYGEDGFSFKSDVDVTPAMISAAQQKLKNSDWLGDNQWSSSNIDSLFDGVEGRWLSFAAEFYQESVADADVITLALGNTNFGTFMFDSIKELFFNPNTPCAFPSRYHIDEVYLMAERAGIDDELMNMIKDLINNEIDPMLNEQFKDVANEVLPEDVGGYVIDPYNLLDYNNDGTKTKGELIKYIVEYCVLSYIVGYIASLERIVALNPDVEIIQVALMNSYKTENSTAEKDGTSFADMIDMLYGPMNAFISMLPDYLASKSPTKYEEATFYYADCGTVETLSAVYGDDFYTYKGQAITYDKYQELRASEDFEVDWLGHNTNSTVRSRFHKWIAGADGCKHDCSGGGQLSDWGAHAYISDCYLCMEIKHGPNDSTYGWGKFEYAELLKYILGPMECPYPDDTISPTQADIDKYNSGWDFSKFFNKYRIVMVTEEDVREYEKLTTQQKNAMLASDEEFNSYTTQKGTIVPYTSTKDGVTAKVRKADWAFSCAMYLALEEATIMAGNQEFMMSDLTGVQGFTTETFKGAAKLFADKMGVPSVVGEVSALETAVDADTITKNFRDALLEDGPSATMLCLANRMQIGNGIGGHPSEGGHNTMAAAIIRDYEAKNTGDEAIAIFLQSFMKNYPHLAAAIGAYEGIGNVDDLAIIITMLKMKQASGDIPALEGVDLDALEAQIRDLQVKFEEDLAYEDQVFVLESANSLMEYVEKLAYEATYSKYEVTENSFYVSLGDSNVNGYGLEGYIDGMHNGLGQVIDGSAPVELAKRLYGENWKDHFGQYAQGALRCEDMLWLLGADGSINDDSYRVTEIADNLLVDGDIKATQKAYIDAIKKADLISLAIGGGNVTTFVGRQVDLALAEKDLVEMDWAKVGVDETEEVKELNDLLDLMVPIIDELGILDSYLPEGMEAVENPAYFARVLAESLLYGYASYNYYYPQVLAKIHEINPNAQLLILGMFNPVDDWTLTTTIDGEEQVVPIGGAINNIMTAANLENLAYAIQTPNTTFIDLSDNITFLDEKIAGGFKPTFADYYKEILQDNGKQVHASKAGHEYMTQQMYNALQEDFEDMTCENIEELIDVLLPIMVEAFERYGPEVARQVWQQWEEYGYVDLVEGYIDELVTMLNDRYTYYTETALPEINESVQELSAQKNSLAAELSDLNAQLAAKKAQLEEVLASHEIGKVYVPNIDIHADANEQTKVYEHTCDGTAEGCQIKGELEAAIADLEHAIATVEALIKDVNADIETMVDLAEQIADAVAELQKTIESVVAAGEDLSAAIEAAVAVMTEDADVTVDAIVTAFDAASATVMAASDVLELAMGTANDMITDIDGLIDMLIADFDELYNKFVTELPGCLETDVGQNLIYAGGLTAAGIQMVLEENKEEINAELNKALAELDATYGPQIAELEEELADLQAKIEEEADAKYKLAASELQAAYETEKAALEAKKAALEDELAGYQAELAGYQKQLADAAAAETIKQIEAAMNGVQAQIDRVTNDIETVNTDLACALEHLNTALECAYEAAVAEVTAAYQKAIDALNKAIADLKAEYEAAVKALKDAAEKKLAELGAIGEEIAAALEELYQQFRDELDAATKAIESILNGSKEAVEELKKALIAIGGETAEDIIAKGDEVIKAIKDIFEAATTADLLIDNDFKYVAIGDGSAKSDSYAEILAEYLNTEAKENKVNSIDFVNYAEEGNTVAAERETLKKRTDLADADLITIGFSHIGFLDDAISGNTVVDWASIVGKENVSYIDKLMDEVEAKIAGTAIPADMQAKAVDIVEAYAYSAAEYATELPELINEINAVNPDAVIVIVGMSNPFKNITLALDETTTLDISEYVDYLVAGVAVHGTACAILSDNAIYVDAPAAAPIYDKSEITMAEIALYGMGGLADRLYSSKDGHAYTADKIIGALNLIFRTDILWGDADGNGEIQTNDAKLILQYCAEMIGEDDLDLTVSDVDGNGIIQTNDAKLILQYCAEMIKIFPVEK